MGKSESHLPALFVRALTYAQALLLPNFHLCCLQVTELLQEPAASFQMKTFD